MNTMTFLIEDARRRYSGSLNSWATGVEHARTAPLAMRLALNEPPVPSLIRALSYIYSAEQRHARLRVENALRRALTKPLSQVEQTQCKRMARGLYWSAFVANWNRTL